MDHGQVKRILVVDDDPAQLRLMERVLSKTGHEILTASDGQEALTIVGREEPRIVVADWNMPGMSGLELCSALRTHEGVRFIYIIIVTSHDEGGKVVEAFDAGADDYLRKPLNKDELLARLRAADRIVSLESDLAKRTREIHRVNAEMALTHQKLNKANERLQRMATIDELTGVLNRREGMRCVREFWEAQERYKQVLSCIMIDIDHFKLFNDSYGHAAGDVVLRETAHVLANTTRTTDRVCRMGGEEFLVLCPNVGLDGAAVCAEHLRRAVAEHVFTFEGQALNVSISLGVAQKSDSMGKPDDLIMAADGAMYESKRSGRNRVTMSDGSRLQVGG